MCNVSSKKELSQNVRHGRDISSKVPFDHLKLNVLLVHASSLPSGVNLEHENPIEALGKIQNSLQMEVRHK